ncbi:MAG: hypothetical protein P3W87_004765, partial [Gammaproteobacteria bacterium]|nr:hypothetical protein [Gammaproteobacteria bacterium]
MKPTRLKATNLDWIARLPEVSPFILYQRDDLLALLDQRDSLDKQIKQQYQALEEAIAAGWTSMEIELAQSNAKEYSMTDKSAPVSLKAFEAALSRIERGLSTVDDADLIRCYVDEMRESQGKRKVWRIEDYLIESGMAYRVVESGGIDKFTDQLLREAQENAVLIYENREEIMEYV